MKIKIILQFLFFFFLTFSYAQKDSVLLDLAKRNQIHHISSSFQDLKDGIFSYYQVDIDALDVDNPFYNNSLVNNYFKGIITSYATNTGDLSFNNYFANINSTEGTLTIGKSFRMDNFYWKKEKRQQNKKLKDLKKVTNLFTFYAKSNYNNGFANLYSEKKAKDGTESFQFNSDLGVGFKYTHVNRGKLWTKQSKKILDFRNSFVKSAVDTKIAIYEKTQLKKDLAVKNYGQTDHNTRKKNRKELVQKKYLEFYKDIVDEELKYFESQNLISKSRVTWWSISGYIPLTSSIVKHSTDLVEINESTYKDYNFKANFNVLCSFFTKTLFKTISSKLTIEGAYFNTNTFVANNNSTLKFQSIRQDNGDKLILGAVENVFEGSYNDFWGRSIKGEFVLLLFDNLVGISAAAEKTFGLVENENWKLGIPFSLKDKDGKSTVNFELQWREFNRNHFVGIAVGYNFGRFIQ